MNFSPARYWIVMYFCDLLLYWILVVIITCAMVSVLHIMVPTEHFFYIDLSKLRIPVYGYGSTYQKAEIRHERYVMLANIFAKIYRIMDYLYDLKCKVPFTPRVSTII